MDKFQACMVLHALGDTIGFKNGDWEFNYGQTNLTPEVSNDRLFEFIELGGINQINLKNWIVSDDTIMHIATAESLLENYKSINDFGNILAKKYVESFKDMNNRWHGEWTKKSIPKLESGTKWNELPYDTRAGGNGGAMRACCIGLIYHGKKRRSDLIAMSIEAGRVTHNYVVGYLGSLVSALFTAYAIEKVEIARWPFKLIALFKSGKIESYLKKTRGYDDYMRDKDIFIDRWQKYIAYRYLGKQLRFNKARRSPAYRSQSYIDNFSIKKKGENEFPGDMGQDSVIIAFDSLVDAAHEPVAWEKLVVYSMLHLGDSDTTGAIAAAWYGAMFGFLDIPSNNLKYLEYKKKLMALGEKLYLKAQSI